MKDILRTLFLLLFITTIIQSQNFKITHYDFDFELLPSQHKLIAESIVTVKSLDSNLVNEITFDLMYDKIESILDSLNNKIEFKETNGKLILKFSKPIKTNEVLKIKFNYSGEFLGRVSNRIDKKNSWLLMESNYFPWIGEMNLSNWAIFNAKITVPDTMTVVAVGDLISVDALNKKKTFHYSSNIPKNNFSICAANYVIQEQTKYNINIKTFLYPEHKERNDTLVHLFSEALNFYQNNFGKYPFSEFRIVETNRRGGYAPEQQMLLNSEIVSNTDNFSRFTIAHEVAHQWFPHKIHFFPEYYLNESFAQYATISYMESKGKMYNIKDNVTVIGLPFVTWKFDGNNYELFRFTNHSVYEEKLLSEISIHDKKNYYWGGYYKGYFLLASLASTLGVDDFNLSIKSLNQKNLQTITLSDFTKHLEKTSQKKLEPIVKNWTTTSKVLDYEISNITNTKLSSGKYNSKIEINNVGEITVPFKIYAKTKNGKTLTCKVDSFKNDKAICAVAANSEIIAAEIDSKWLLLDANRINNYYPRKRRFSFLISDYSVTKEQYFYYPSITFGERDKARLGLWLTNIYPIIPEVFAKNAEIFKFRTALFYGFNTQRIGYYFDFKTFIGMPTYRWNWGMNLSNYRGTENYNLLLDYIFQKDEKYFMHSIVTASANRNLIYDMEYYDKRDFEKGTNTSVSFSWDRLLISEKENITIKFGSKLLGSDYAYTKISVALENVIPISSKWFKYRLFGGIVRGNHPVQESVHLSGGVYPTTFAYWFVDPDNNISTQENLHVKGDANLRGYIGQHLKGESGFGINVEIPIPKLTFINLFVDIGNVWDSSFGTLKYDAGVGFDFKILRIDFPFYINKPLNNEKEFDFRWLLEFSF